MKLNNRLNSISEYHFQKLDELKSKLLLEGRDITDLSIGDPDLLVNENIITALIKGLQSKGYNRYPPYEGIKELKRQIIKYYDEVFSVKLSLDEVIILIGSKEGINNLIPAICDIGDYAIIPQLGYPVYNTCSHLWGVKTYKLPLHESQGYLPKIEHIPEHILKKSKLMLINYPNNPTGAVANESFFKETIEFCEKNDIVFANDAAYNEILPEGIKPLSLLSFDIKRKCLEFGTFSKTFNMTGFRVGYAVGNSQVIKALLKVKSNVDSGQFLPIQMAACEALNLNRSYVDSIRRIYDERRNVVLKNLDKCKIKYFKPEGTFYVWCQVPKNYTIDEFCAELLNDYCIIVTPGYVFGDIAHKHFRIALTAEGESIDKAMGLLKFYN